MFNRSTRISLGFTSVIAMFVGLMASRCSTSPPGELDLNFFQNGVLVNAQSVQTIFVDSAFGPAVLAPTPSIALDSSDVSASFFSDAANADNAAVAMLFARDPREMFDNLRSLLNDDATWATETDFQHLPQALLMYSNGPVPALGGGTLRQFTVYDPLKPFSFWFPNVTPIGKAAAPDGSGSVKSAFAYEHGACVSSVSMFDIVKPVSDALEVGFFQGVKNQGLGCTDAERVWSHASSYLFHQSVAGQAGPPAPDIFPRGGFFVNFFYRTHVYAPIPDTNIQFNFNYEFRLDDGRLGVVAVENGENVTGFNENTISTTFRDGLQNTVAQTIFNQADRRQTIDFGACVPDNPANPLDTSITDMDPGINAMPCPLSSIAIQALTGCVTGGSQSLGLSQSEITQLQQTILASNPVTRKFNNWQCVNRAPAGARRNFRCEYVVRAKRLNVYPDEVHLVWFDGKELDNNAYAAHVAAINSQCLNFLGRSGKDMCTADFRRDAFHASFFNDLRGDQLVPADFTDFPTCALNNFGDFFTGAFFAVGDFLKENLFGGAISWIFP